MTRLPRGWAAATTFVLLGACAGAPEPASPAAAQRSTRTRAPELAAEVAGLERRAGLFDLYLDHAKGRLLAVLPPPAADGVLGEYLYVEGIVTGLGSNPVGLDRGQLGESRILRLRRVGARVLFEEPNLRYRALSEDVEEVAAVRQSFATSVHWAGEIVGEDAAGRLLVDLTDFVVRDAHGSAARLQEVGRCSPSPAPTRAAKCGR
jgi:hypothetical protein